MKAPRVLVHYTHQARRPHPCPTCRKSLDMATNAAENDDSTPVAGSMVLCIHCGHVATFTADMLLRLLRVEELRAACQAPSFVTAYAAMARKRQEYRRAHGLKDDQ